MLENYKSIVSEEIIETVMQIDDTALQEACKLIISCEKNHGRVHLTGIGKPSYVAAYGASLLSSTGTPSYFLDGTEAIHGSSGQVAVGDVVIAISNSGETKELLLTVENLKRNQAKVISISRKLDSTLSKIADVALYASVVQECDDLNKAPRMSIISELIVLQALSILLQNNRNLTNDDYVKWHPGGMLGQSILKDEI